MVHRKSKKFSFSNVDLPKLFYWASSHDYFSLLNGNNFSTNYGAFPQILFIGKVDSVESSENSFAKLKQLTDNHNDWLYGFFSYDLKNEIEELVSNNPATIPVQHLGFYVPETVISVHENEIEIQTVYEPDALFRQIERHEFNTRDAANDINQLSCNTTKRQYLDYIKKIKTAIVEGEFYEINFCIEFSCSAISFEPANCYLQLNKVSPMPFSVYMKIGDIHIICASPERFLKKSGNKIVSQPIKGTTRRSFDKSEDERLKQSLQSSEKERAENMMIVDLVRNDLAKSAQTGSVVVDEMFGIYTFKKVHQMISTVSATTNPTIHPIDIIKHAFPMGSMTGAPKVRVMEEIESLEHSTRGLYSGAIGYYSPNMDFDFNVVIRSLIYDAKTKTISFHVGSAITFDSDPEHEYNECLLKAESMLEVLSSSIPDH